MTGEARTGRSLLLRIAGLFAPYRGRMLLLCGAIAASSVLSVATAFLTKLVFDRTNLFGRGHGHVNLGLLTALVGAMLGAALLGGAIAIGQTYLGSAIGQNVMHDLRDRVYVHLQQMSLRFFTSTRTGEIQSRLANDIGGIRTAVTDTVSVLLADTVFVLVAVAAMFALSWQLTLVSLAVVPLFAFLAQRVGEERRRLASSTQRSLAELSVLAEETLSAPGFLLARVFDRQRHSIERFRSESRRLADLQVRQQMAGRTLIGAFQTFVIVSPALAYFASGFVHVSAGTLVAFTFLQTRLLSPVAQLLQGTIDLRASLALFERIFQYLELPHDIVESPRAQALPKDAIRGRIAFREVSFRYESASANGTGAGRGRPWALEGLDLEIEPGQLAALVGPSGAGKTTFSYLVARLYDPVEGSVVIDGVDVRDLQLGSLAGAIGMVTQETYLFHASIRENLLYARPDSTDAELQAAARAAAIHDRIMELEDGYDTLAGERGYRMSGGERQRLAIARVVLKDPPILVLDEATSALDTISERLVQAALAPLMSGRTTIAIAHRLSTILAADVIFVLDRGRLVQRGTHAELVRQDGLYAELYRHQFGGGVVEALCEDGVVLASGDVLVNETVAPR